MADDRLDHDLYALDPEEFTAARNELAKQLRAEGRRDHATAVGKLRRPSVTAWALDAVARERPELIGAVLDAGAELRAATDRALEGDASGLRDAQATERRAVDAVTAAAGAHLEAAGKSGGDAARQRMAATLRAAVVGPSVAESLVAGVLATDHDAPGFGFEAGTEGGAVAAPPRRGSSQPRRARPAGPPREADDAPGQGGDELARRRRLQEVRAEADEAEQRSRQAERTATDAGRRAGALRSAATKAAAEAEQAVNRAADLRRQAEAAEQRADATRAEAEEAAGRAVDARARADDAS